MKRAIAASSIGLLLALPTLAVAADGLQFGPLRAHPALELREEHDDNIFLQSSGGEADWITTVAPGLRLVLPVRRFTLEAEGGAEIIRYHDRTEEDATNWLVGGALGAVFPGGLDFRLSDRYTKTYLTSSQEYGAGEESTVNAAALKVGYQIRDALRLEVEGGVSNLRYGESASRERDETRVQADLSWRFLPRTSVFAEVAHTVYDYTSRSEQDGTATAGALGLSWLATGRSTGTIKAGVEHKDYDTEDAAVGLEARTTWIVAGRLQHVFTRRTSGSLEISRGTLESDFSDNPYFERTAAGAELRQRVTAKIYGRAGLRYEHDAYPNDTTYDNPYDGEAVTETGERTDEAVSASLALGYDVLDWLNLEVGWRGKRRTSSYGSFEYDGNRFSIGARAAF